MKKILSIAVLSLLLSAPLYAEKLSGVVTFEGTAPDPKSLRMNADPNCAEHYDGEDVYDPQVVLSETGGLKNVFVYLKAGVSGDYAAPEDSVVLDQKGCLFTPRVLGLRVGQSLEMINSDPTLHNVHAQAKTQKRFNVGLPVQGMKMSRSFNKEEVMVTIKCDVHPWMRAYAGVLEHPFFAVTDENGAFEISDIPAGIYEVEIWHEVFGRQSREVILKDAPEQLDFTYTEN